MKKLLQYGFLVLFAALSLDAQSTGDLVYDSGDNRFEYYDGSKWIGVDSLDTLVACSSEGTMRYDSTNHRLEFCNGTTWHSMMGADTSNACSKVGEMEFNTGNNLFEVCSGSTNTWRSLFESDVDIAIGDETEPEGENVVFAVYLNRTVDADLDVDWSTADNTATAGTDYTAASGTLTIPSGQTFGLITITTTDVASTCDDNKDFFLNLTSSNFGTIIDSQAVGTILETDVPEVNIADDSETEGTTQTFNVTLSFACPSKAMGFDYYTFDMTATGGTDYTSTSGSISIPAGNTTDSFNVTVTSDTIAEMDEVFAIGIHNYSNTKVSGTGFARGTIQDDDVGAETTVKIEAGQYQTCALSSSGRVKCWGRFGIPFRDIPNNIYRDIDVWGNQPHETWNNTPFADFGTHDGLDVTPHTVKSASVPGGNNGCVILDDDRVKCWGYRFGYGNVYVNDGAEHGFHKDTMGDNLPYTDLGTVDKLGVTPHTAKQVEVSDYQEVICVILDDDRLKCWGASGSGNHEAMLGQETSTCCVGDVAGEIGDNLDYIDLGTHDGLGATTHTVKKVHMSGSEICAILDDDRIKCWGGDSGMAYGDTTRRGNSPGDMGDNLGYLDLGTHDGLSVTPHTAKDIAGDGGSFCAILDDDRLKCWGQNNHGQLGLGDTNHRGDQSGELGDNLPYVDMGTHDGLSVTPHTVKDIISHAQNDFCAILDDDRMKCWGNPGQGGDYGSGTDLSTIGDDSGEMGDNLDYVKLGTGRTAKKARLVGYTTDSLLVIRDDDTLVGYAGNFAGELGLGTTQEYFGNELTEVGDNSTVIDLGGLTPVDFASGGDESLNCIIFSNGQMKCVGKSAGSLPHIGEKGHVGDNSGEMGSQLMDIPLPAGRTALDIFMSQDDMCILLDTYEYYCGGYNMGYNEGYGGANPTLSLLNGADQIKYHHHNENACLLDEYFNLYCWDMGPEDPSAMSPIDFGYNLKVIDFSVGENHICAILSDQTLRCWGEAGRGQIGSEDTTDIAAPSPALEPVDLGTVSYPIKVSAMKDNNCVLFANGGVKCFGRHSQINSNSGSSEIGNEPGEMGDTLAFVDFGVGRTVTKMFPAEYADICVRLDNDDTVCWGDNGVGAWYDYQPSGQVGNGTTSDLDAPNGSYTALDLNGDLVEQLDMSSMHACALTENNDVKCWGGNPFGELGLEDVENRGDEPGEMGSSLPSLDINWAADVDVKRIFVSSGTYDGNLGGLSGADTSCQGLADAQTLGGTWKAILSDSSTDASAHVNQPANEIQMVDGTVIARGWNDLIDAMIANRIDIDEAGATTIVANVWTGSNNDLTKASATATSQCNDWASNSGANSGYFGDSSKVDGNWANTGTATCDTSTHRLYCLEQ